MYSSIKDENFQKEIFGEYITALKEQEKEHERRRKEEKVNFVIDLRSKFLLSSYSIYM